VLASASPARLATLRAAGARPETVVSGVDESSVAGPPAEVALELACRKARAVAARPELVGALVLGCDSVLDLDGEAMGKPADPQVARQRWLRMRGRTGHLVTGHCVVRTDDGREAAGVDRTRVRFAALSEAEIDAYVATGEPLAVAGGFTVDGLGGWFVESVDGAPSNVVGVSLPLLRGLLEELGVSVPQLWVSELWVSEPGPPEPAG
jgi:septum formation protein